MGGTVIRPVMPGRQGKGYWALWPPGAVAGIGRKETSWPRTLGPE